jgi:hypothetical protein
MSRKPPSRDEALEAIDFIVNVLKEHEKDLDRLINELGTVVDKMGDTGELSGKVEKVEERLSNLQNEITNLITYLSAPRETAPMPITQRPETKYNTTQEKQVTGPPVILRCKQWDDFQGMASRAESVSFLFKEQEKTFQVDALRNNQVITYSGELPKQASMLKSWLAKQLSVDESRVLEGILAIG